MSYTPEHEKLNPSTQKILDGIVEFNEVVNNRVKNTENYEQTHLNQINEIRKTLNDLQLKLELLYHETV